MLVGVAMNGPVLTLETNKDHTLQGNKQNMFKSVSLKQTKQVNE